MRQARRRLARTLTAIGGGRRSPGASLSAAHTGLCAGKTSPAVARLCHNHICSAPSRPVCGKPPIEPAWRAPLVWSRSYQNPRAELGERDMVTKARRARRKVDRPDGETATASAADACSKTIFKDREESEFYAQCVRDFLFRHGYELLENKEIVELGVGTGETIVELLKYHDFTGKINGYEIDRASYEYAQKVIADHSVGDRYIVINDDFFAAVLNSVAGGGAISNPPYLPACERPTQIPELWGGLDGSQVTKQIVECGFECLILLISSFSNPLSVIEHALSHGYKVLDFAVRTMRFGTYSRE